MTSESIKQEYFEWMMRWISYGTRRNVESYREVLNHLHSVPFSYSLPMDGNRFEDGIDLRYRFGYECNYTKPEIACLIDCKCCSILEMMVALAIRCEEHIMCDSDYGDRTGYWFWIMIDSLGLGTQYGIRYDTDYTNMVLTRFLNREYEPNGKGGLFTIEDCRYDMRSIDIWYQMCWYLNDKE